MKRLCFAYTAVFLLTSSAYPQEGNAVSLPVGFVRINVPANDRILASLPFVPTDEGVQAVLGQRMVGTASGGMPGGWLKVLKWESQRQAYIQAINVQSGMSDLDAPWFTDLDALTASEMTLFPGEGFWIQDGSGRNRTIYLWGEVELSPSNHVPLHVGFNLVGYPYSTSVKLEDSALGELLADDTSESTTGLIQVMPDGTPQPTNRFSIGHGYWLRREQGGPVVWTEPRPYNDPFPHNGEPPAITSLQMQDSGSSAQLHINCSGTPGERLDIFYQDLTPDTAFDPSCGWMQAEFDIQTRGNTSVLWRDVGSDSRCPVSEVAGRVYLVGRSDLDLNEDDAADARAYFLSQSPPSGGLPSGPATTSEDAGTGCGSGLGVGGGTGSGDREAEAAGCLIYVDRVNGDDSFTGRSLVRASGHGPKRTINAALAEGRTGDLVVVRSGDYGEDVAFTKQGLSMRIVGQVSLTGSRRPGPPIVRPAFREAPSLTE